LSDQLRIFRGLDRAVRQASEGAPW